MRTAEERLEERYVIYCYSIKQLLTKNYYHSDWGTILKAINSAASKYIKAF